MTSDAVPARLRRESEILRPSLTTLGGIDEQLAYLALLTHVGLKPLSRWEKPLPTEGLNALTTMGLTTAQVRRTVKNGSEVIETIFAVGDAYAGLYRDRFADTAIDKSAQTTRWEGFLFGFPPCCVEQYIQQPYAHNDLAIDDQRILFHWVCRGCPITARLLPHYREVYQTLTTLCSGVLRKSP